jgi:predicted RNA-binding protein with RPS1 domain
VTDPSQVVKPGDELEVKILRVDESRQKISLSLKQLTEDPRTQASPPPADTRDATAADDAEPPAPAEGFAPLHGFSFRRRVRSHTRTR